MLKSPWFRGKEKPNNLANNCGQPVEHCTIGSACGCAKVLKPKQLTQWPTKNPPRRPLPQALRLN